MKLNYAKLRESASLPDGTPEERVAKERALAHMGDLFADRRMRDQFDLGRLFEEFFGWQEYRACRQNRTGRPVHAVFEAAGAVNTAAFASSIGQWVFGAVKAANAAPDIVFSKVIPARDSTSKVERNYGVTEIGDEALVVDEGEEYPIVGVSEDYTETPETLKRGFIIPVTWECFFFERTQGQIRQRIDNRAKWMEVNKEKRAIDCVIDAGETATNKYRYRWLGNTIATYGANSGTHTWDNLVTTNPMTDYLNLKAAYLKAVGLTDPFTGEPITTSFNDIVVSPANAWDVPHMMGGTVNQLTPGYATSGNPINTNYANPAGSIVGSLRTLSSQLLQARMTAASVTAGTWYVGNVAEAFEYIQNLPTESTVAPAGSEAEFTKDIVLRAKVREMGTYSTVEPRKMVKNTP